MLCLLKATPKNCDARDPQYKTRKKWSKDQGHEQIEATQPDYAKQTRHENWNTEQGLQQPNIWRDTPRAKEQFAPVALGEGLVQRGTDPLPIKSSTGQKLSPAAIAAPP